MSTYTIQKSRNAGRTAFIWSAALGAAWIVFGVVGIIGSMHPVFMPGLFTLLFLLGLACFPAAVVMVIVGAVKTSSAPTAVSHPR